MPNARKALVPLLGALALVACHKQAPQNQLDNRDISMDDNLTETTGQIPSNAEIETLPQDESSATPSNQLQTGYDNPDVNDLGNSH